MIRAALALLGSIAVAGLVACGTSSPATSPESPRTDGGAETSAGPPPNDGGRDTSAEPPPHDGGEEASSTDGSPTLTDASMQTGTDSGVAQESGSDASDAGIVLGAPISATPDQWTWVPFADAFCGDGSTTGLGINPSSTGASVLIYFEGGGACWDEVTCYTAMTAGNFTTGYTQANFATQSTDVSYLALPGGFFDRTASANPFKDYSYVYVPYCTGDVFAGNNVSTLGTHTAHFVGHANVASYLSRLVPTFPSADRVILAGSSAGGFGAVYNWWQTQAAFGSIRVDMIDDSGTFMPQDVLAEGNGAEGAQVAAWNVAATLPPCAACATNPAAFYDFYAKSFPTHRGALLSYSADTVLPNFFGVTAAEFTTGLDEDLTIELAPNPNAQAFVLGGSGHVLFFKPLVAQNGVTLQTFLTQMVTDSPAWTSEHP